MLNQLQLEVNQTNATPDIYQLSNMLPVLKFLFANSFAGFDVMTLANNHLNDFGELPVDYTVNALKEIGIKTVGVTYGPYNSRQVTADLPLITLKGFKGEVYSDHGRPYNFYLYH